MQNHEFEIVATYTTAEAVEDGTLILVDENIRTEAGIRYPVYLTQAVYEKYVKVPKGMEGIQDETGRLWDVLLMFAIKAKMTKSAVLFFQLICRLPNEGDWESNEKRPLKDDTIREVHLKAICTGRDFDDPSPAIFIMKPSED
jgi:hypothetical protein